MRIFSVLAILIVTLMLAQTSFAAANLSYECALSGVAVDGLVGCPSNSANGYETSATAVTGNGSCSGSNSYCGARSDPGVAIVPIDIWNVCRWIANTGTESIFVPFKSQEEWAKFNENASNISLFHCGVPYAETGAAATANITPPYASCTSMVFNAPTVYGRTNMSLWPAPAAGENFTCHNGATTIMALLQWIAGDADTTAKGNLSWNQNNLFSPDLTLVATSASNKTNSGTSITISTGTSVVLSWGTSASAVSCMASGGWNGSVSASGGSQTVTPSTTTTYNIACTDNNQLTSTTSVTVNVTGATSCPAQSNLSWGGTSSCTGSIPGSPVGSVQTVVNVTVNYSGSETGTCQSNGTWSFSNQTCSTSGSICSGTNCDPCWAAGKCVGAFSAFGSTGLSYNSSNGSLVSSEASYCTSAPPGSTCIEGQGFLDPSAKRAQYVNQTLTPFFNSFSDLMAGHFVQIAGNEFVATFSPNPNYPINMVASAPPAPMGSGSYFIESNFAGDPNKGNGQYPGTWGDPNTPFSQFIADPSAQCPSSINDTSLALTCSDAYRTQYEKYNGFCHFTYYTPSKSSWPPQLGGYHAELYVPPLQVGGNTPFTWFDGIIGQCSSPTE